MDLHDSLKHYFNFEQFRPGQQQVLESLAQGYSSLAVFPTGSGKSLCYQLAAVQLPHLTLVVSPLLALIKDQLDFLHQHNIPAASIDSSQSPEQQQQIRAQVRSGECKILMISVERFKNEYFRHFIDSIPLSLLVVDEAHCISEWGHNFRPDYLKLPLIQKQLSIPQVLLLTATATEKVQKDMANKFEVKPEQIIQTGFYRQNLALKVVGCSNQQKLPFIQTYLAQQSAVGIVYVTLQKTAESIASALLQSGIKAQAYHAGLATDKRQRLQQDFMQGRYQVMVATIAFGMGIDKSDIGFVIHYDLPKSLENYSQEVGRAGRGGQNAECITLANLDDLPVLQNFIYGDTPELNSLCLLLQDIFTPNGDQKWETRHLSLSKKTNIRQLALKTLLVQLEMSGYIEPLFSYHAELRYQCLVPQEVIVQRFSDERRLFIEAVFHHTQFKKVWGELDMQALLLDYQCPRSRVTTSLQWLEEQELIKLETKQLTEVYRVNQQTVDIGALAHTLLTYCQEKQQSEIQRIDKLIEFLGSEHCLSHQLAVYFNDLHAPSQCGMCSSCLQATPQIQRYQPTPDLSQLPVVQWLTELNQALPNHTPVTAHLGSRFMAGIAVPLFTTIKARQLSGYGKLADIPFQEILHLTEKHLPST